MSLPRFQFDIMMRNLHLACSSRLCVSLLIKNHDLLNLLSIIADVIIWKSSQRAARSKVLWDNKIS